MSVFFLVSLISNTINVVLGAITSHQNDLIHFMFSFSLQVFYLYLYIGSMLFLLFMYATMFWGSRSNSSVTSKFWHYFYNHCLCFRQENHRLKTREKMCLFMNCKRKMALVSVPTGTFMRRNFLDKKYQMLGQGVGSVFSYEEVCQMEIVEIILAECLQK